MRGASWPPSGPLPPVDVLAAGRVDARRLLRSPSLAAAHHYCLLTPPRAACVFHGFLPPSPWEGCHSVHVNAATQSTGLLPPSPRERCHVDHGKVATHARRSLPPSEQRDAGSLLLV